jgi:hypothetical protein
MGIDIAADVAPITKVDERDASGEVELGEVDVAAELVAIKLVGES